MRLPSFYLIGAAKSGTTTLYKYLQRHPDVYLPEQKEPEFFARDDLYAQGIASYAQLFRDAEPGQSCGEASTIYTRYPQFPGVAERIARHTPHARLIYLMREPVERAYSHYVQEVKTVQNLGGPWADRASFEVALHRSSVYLDSSDYRRQLEQYLRYFRREQILPLLFEDLVQRPQEVVARVVDFLGLDSKLDLVEEGVIAANRASEHFERHTRRALTRALAGTALGRVGRALAPRRARELAWRLLLRSPWARRVRHSYTPPPMLAATRESLRAHFAPQVDRLEQFLGISLDVWRRTG
jgi:hypothetical protein